MLGQGLVWTRLLWESKNMLQSSCLIPALLTLVTAACSKSADRPAQHQGSNAPASVQGSAAPTAQTCASHACIAAAGEALVAHLDDPDVQRRAFETFRSACNAGVMEGCSQVGGLYAEGIGTAVDLGKARQLYEQACNGSDGLGCSNLGALYAKGEDVARDDAKAASLYQRACDGGFLLACTNLGFMYARGTGVAIDPAKALALYGRACEGDEPKACVNLGSTYLRGTSAVKADRAKAVEYYRKACGLGDQPSCDWVAKHQG
jgi:TPR repeat protein